MSRKFIIESLTEGELNAAILSLCNSYESATREERIEHFGSAMNVNAAKNVLRKLRGARPETIAERRGNR